MAKHVISFRVTVNEVTQLRDYVVGYGYESISELYSLILTESIRLKFKRVIIAGETIPQAARINQGVYLAIKERAAPEIKDSPSVWCGLAVHRWLYMAGEEDSRQQNTRYYNDWCREQAARHRQRVKVH